jgi:hypothetical protein
VQTLVAATAGWVGEVHPHVRHLYRTRDWLLTLHPAAGPALLIAALTHDIERAFPSEQAAPSSDDPASREYNTWHQERSAEIVRRWLEGRRAPQRLIDEVVSLVLAHEYGGWPEANLLQAADSLSFLEVQVDLFAERVVRGQLSGRAAERKLQFMYERVQVARARELAAPMMQDGLARIATASGERDATSQPTSDAT